MMRRRRGVGLLGVAAVAGVAHHAGSQSAQAQAQEQAQNEQIADLQAQQYAAAPAAAAPAPAAAADSTTAQLTNLASLHTAGVLSDAEFAAAKAKLLGI